MLSKYRLEQGEYDKFAEKYIAKIGKDNFLYYSEDVSRRLETMKNGEIFDIIKNVKEENYELFIKIACFIIALHNSKYSSWFFSDDFTKIEYRQWQTGLESGTKKKSNS
jgi:hypothetical protein